MMSQQQEHASSMEGAGPGTRDSAGKEEQKTAIIRQARRNVGLLLEALEKGRITTPLRESGNLSRNVLKAFSSSEKVSLEIFISSGGLKAILAAISKYLSSSEVISAGCDSISTLTIVNNKIVAELSKIGAVDVIVKAISALSREGCEDALVAAMKVLRNLTHTEENRCAIYKAGGLDAVIETMKHGSASARLLSHGALVLSNLAFGNTEIKAAVGQLGGVKAIVHGMTRHSDNQGMQARGCLALRNLCYGCEENHDIAADVGAADALLKTIEMYSDDREVVHQSCVALANLSNASIVNRGKIVEAGGGRVAVKLMEMYGNSSTVHDDAISIIRNICVESAAARKEVGECGGVARIVMAMEKFNEGKLLEKACCAIRYLCFLDKNRERVSEAGGMEKLTAVIKKFIGNVEIVEHGLLAIGNAAFESAENKAHIGRCGGITAVIKAIEHHRLQERVQEHGCRVLRNLADGYEINRRLLAENGGINMGVFAMMGYPDCASVQEQACAMLLNIVLCEDYVKRIEQADVKRLAEKAISLHPKHRGVLLQAGTLIDRLNGHDVTTRETERDPAAPQRTQTALRKLTKKFSRVGS